MREKLGGALGNRADAVELDDVARMTSADQEGLLQRLTFLAKPQNIGKESNLCSIPNKLLRDHPPIERPIIAKESLPVRRSMPITLSSFGCLALLRKTHAAMPKTDASVGKNSMPGKLHFR